jgi:hypothetical protein
MDGVFEVFESPVFSPAGDDFKDDGASEDFNSLWVVLVVLLEPVVLRLGPDSVLVVLATASPVFRLGPDAAVLEPVLVVLLVLSVPFSGDGDVVDLDPP